MENGNKSKKHPKGLAVLFFTELWERFGFYLMLGIFTLYMIAGGDEKFPGLGMSSAESADIYGTYLALVYLTPFFGGLIADKLIGYRKSIFIGGILMAAGYMSLAIPTYPMFFTGLGLIILGNGLFKPNISVLLGKLYETDEYRHLKDSGYNIFYMGINIGAFICNFVAAYLRLEYGWGWAFAAAGVGMLIGVLWLFFGQMSATRIKEVDVISPREEGEDSLGKIFIKLFVPAIVAGVLGWIIPGNILGADSTDAFLFFSIPIVLFYINLIKKAKKEEKEPIKALVTVMAVVIVFWAVFHQNGSALTFWAKNNTDRGFNALTEAVFTPLKLSEEASTVPRISEKSGLHGEFEGYELGESYYFENFTGEKPTQFADKGVIPQDIKVVYRPEYLIKLDSTFRANIGSAKKEETKKELQNKYDEWKKVKEQLFVEIGVESENDLSWDKIEEVRKGKWGSIKIWPTELQASINPFYIIILTPLVLAFFSFLNRRKKGLSTPAKIGFGMLITSLSMLVMVGAAFVSENGLTKTSVGWLFGVYGVITIGELFLSPMGLALVSKLSPKRIAAVMMGGWFLSTALGNKLSGVLSGFWDFFDKKEYFFLTNVGLAMIAAIAIFMLVPWLRKVVDEYSE